MGGVWQQRGACGGASVCVAWNVVCTLNLCYLLRVHIPRFPQDEADDFVLATNETHTVREFVEKSFAAVGTKVAWVGEGVNEKGLDASDESRTLVAIDPAYFRPTEVRRRGEGRGVWMGGM